MTKFEVLVSKEAVSVFDGLTRNAEERMKEYLARLGEDPFQARPDADIKRLNGGQDPPLFQLRVGDYRAIYFVVGSQVRMTEVLHRSKAYRGVD